MEDCKITLRQIKTESRNILSSVNYMIKVPNFFTLLENDGSTIKINSPSFEFAHATWQFLFKSKRRLKKTGRWYNLFKVYLKKLNSLVQGRIITFSVLLLDADNEKHDHQHGKYLYTDSLTNCCMGIFRNEHPFFDRRETLTLIIHLICDEIPEVEVFKVMPLANKRAIETTEDYKISLTELPRKALSSINFMMTVPNVFNLPHIDGDGIINSESFEFCNASWQFIFIPDEKLCRISRLYLARLNSAIRKHWISCTILFWNEENNIYDVTVSLFMYKGNDNDDCVMSLNKNLLNRSQNTLTLRAHLICEESPKKHGVQEPLKKQLQEDFERLLLNGKNHDLTLRVADNKEFRVHKDVLMARSPVFESMLSHDMIEKNKSFIDIPDCDPQVMKIFLLYVYCGKLNTLNTTDAVGLYYIADKYNVALLKKQCSQFMKESLSPEIFCDVIKLSINHSDSDLLEYASEYFQNHMHDICTTPKWMSFLTENITAANELLVKASKKWKDSSDKLVQTSTLKKKKKLS